jgi:hypothetical protein
MRKILSLIACLTLPLLGGCVVAPAYVDPAYMQILEQQCEYGDPASCQAYQEQQAYMTTGYLGAGVIGIGVGGVGCGGRGHFGGHR